MKLRIRGKVFGILVLTAALMPFTASGQEMPEGEGRDKVIFACSACHGLDNLLNPSNDLTAADWEFYLYEMIARGAPVQERDIDVVKNYLIDSFAVDKR